MRKHVLDKTNYTFDSTNSLIIFNTNVELRDILLITNVTDGITIYNFACEGQTGDIVANVLSLNYDTSSMEDSDELLIILQEEDLSQETSNDIKLNTRLSERTLNGIVEQLEDIKNLLKLILS